MSSEERPIIVRLEAVGGSQAAEDVERFKEGIEGLAQGEAAAAESTEALRAEIEQLRGQTAGLEQAQQQQNAQHQAFAQAAQQSANNAIQLTQRIAAASAAIGGMAAALGGEGLGATAGLIGRMAAGVAAGAQLGLTFGPGGAIVGGILGAAVPALSALIERQDEAAESARQLRDDVEDSVRAMQEEYNRLTEREDALSGQFGSRSTDSLEGQRRAAEATVAELERQRTEALAEARSARTRVRIDARTGAEIGGEGSSEADARVAALNREITAQREIIRNLQLEETARGQAANAAADQAAATARQTAAAQEAAEAERREREELARRTAASRALEEAMDREAAAMEHYYETIERGIEQVNAARTRELQILADAREKEREDAELMIQAELRAKAAREQATEEAADRQQAFADRSRALLQREQRERTAALDRETESRERELERFSGLANSVGRSLVTAISEIAAGTKSAEEAFTGLLASFLSSIAEMALIEAAKEYASAIGAFARYDYGSGAGHVAAGVAWTAVAVATGAAAGAISAAPTQNAPADRPDRASAGDQSGGGNVVYVTHWNAPVAVAGSEAEVGRTMGRLNQRAHQRYGRLAA